MDKKDLVRIYEKNQNKLIHALLKKIAEIKKLETKIALYETLLTEEEITAADAFAKALEKR